MHLFVKHVAIFGYNCKSTGIDNLLICPLFRKIFYFGNKDVVEKMVKYNNNVIFYLFIYLFKKKDSTDVVKEELKKRNKTKRITTELSSANCRTHPLRERKRDQSLHFSFLVFTVYRSAVNETDHMITIRNITINKLIIFTKN